jgi:hypothetical protein
MLAGLTAGQSFLELGLPFTVDAVRAVDSVPDRFLA